MNTEKARPFTSQQLELWKKSYLNPFEENQVSTRYGPRLTRDQLYAYITDPTRWYQPVCRSVLALFVELRHLEAVIRQDHARRPSGNPFEAEQPFREFPQLKAFHDRPGTLRSLEVAKAMRDELDEFMREIESLRAFVNEHRKA